MTIRGMHMLRHSPSKPGQENDGHASASAAIPLRRRAAEHLSRYAQRRQMRVQMLHGNGRHARAQQRRKVRILTAQNAHDFDFVRQLNRNKPSFLLRRAPAPNPDRLVVWRWPHAAFEQSSPLSAMLQTSWKEATLAEPASASAKSRAARAREI